MTEYKSDTMNFFGNPNVGLFMFVTNKYGLIASSIKDTDIKQLEKIFGIDLIQVSVSGTNLVGVFCAGNDDHLFLPSIIHDNELKYIKEKLDGICKVIVLDTDYTALGNNMICTKNACLVNPEFEDAAIQELGKIFDDVVKVKVDGLNNIGSMIVINSKGLFINHLVKDDEFEIIKKVTGFGEDTIMKSTTNNGNSFVSSGLVANDKGMLIGDASTGVEMQDAFTIFG